MKRSLKILSALLTSTILIAPATLAISAADAEQELNVTVDAAYGGAKGIITPTFDDGDYPTAQKVKALCEKYDLYATLMLIPDRIPEQASATSTRATISQWREIFEDGRLEPQNHSMSHDIALGESTAHSTVDYEVLDSGDLLDEFFPTHDIICFAPRGGAGDNAMSPYARELAMSRYYMVRGGTVSGKAQSLSPTFSFGEPGSWSYIIAPSVDRKSVDTLKTHVDNTVKNGTWLCTLSHLVLDELPDDEKYASAYENVDAWFAYMAEVRDRGDIWVTTVSSAIKYIREHQNTTVTAKLSDGSIVISAEMAEKTQDNLDLSTEMFNHPLSVKIEVPSDMRNLRYAIGGECRTVTAFKEGNESYIRIDVLPGTTVTLTKIEKDGTPHDLEFVEGEAPTCISCGTVDHNVCRDCGQLFDKKGNPIDTVAGDKLGKHSLLDVPRVEATETEEGNIAHKTCTVCGKNFNSVGQELDDVSIPTLTPDTGDDGFSFTELIRNPIVIAALALIVIVAVVIIL